MYSPSEFKLTAWDLEYIDQGQEGRKFLTAGWLGLTTSHASRYERKKISEFTKKFGDKCHTISESFRGEYTQATCLSFFMPEPSIRDELRKFICSITPAREYYVEISLAAIRNDIKVKTIWKNLIRQLRDGNFNISIVNNITIVVSYANQQ